MATTINAPVKANGTVTYPKLRVILDSLQFTLDSIITGTITASRAVVTDASGLLTTATTTSTEIGYVNGVTSAIQTQLDAKASTALSNLASTAVNADIIPATDNIPSLGSVSKRFQKTWTALIGGGTLATTVTGGEIQGAWTIIREAGTPTSPSLTINTPTASSGAIAIVPANNAGNFTVTIQNASHGASRTYTIPDAGAAASFVMTAGSQSIGGSKDFTSPVLITDGTVSAPGLSFSAAGNTDNGIYRIGTDNIGIAIAGAKALDINTSGLDVTGKLSFKDASTIKYQWTAVTGAHDIASFQIGSTVLQSFQDTGEITQPLQPSFLVTDGTGASNVTGDATVYTELWPTEIYDQGGDFTTNTFTAPVTGRYLLSATLRIEGVLSTHTTKNISIVTSNRSYIWTINASLAEAEQSLTVTAIADMDPGDTATVTIVVSGSTKVIDISASGTTNYFSGSLIN